MAETKGTAGASPVCRQPHAGGNDARGGGHRPARGAAKGVRKKVAAYFAARHKRDRTDIAEAVECIEYRSIRKAPLGHLRNATG